MIYVGNIKLEPESGLYVTDDGLILRPIPQWEDRHGYKYITHQKKNFAMHRLVAKAFVDGMSADKNIVMHKDDNPLNNRAENLSWGTYSKNNKDAYDRNLKTNNINIKCVETGEVFPSAREAARKMFGIPKRGDHILQVIRAERPTAYGFHWEVIGR